MKILKRTLKRLQLSKKNLENYYGISIGLPKQEHKNIHVKIISTLEELEKLKQTIPQDLSEHKNEIVKSFEYQMCLASKFSQLLISLYKSNPHKLKEVLKEYSLEHIIYELYVYYIIKGSQTSNKENKSQNICQNDVWVLINTVLLPGVNDQAAIDNLVIKILNDFILNSDPIYSKARVIESLENLPYSYDKVIAYAYANLYQDDTHSIKGQDISHIFKSLQEPKTQPSQEQNNTNKLLLTVLSLNNLKASENKVDQTKISNTLQKAYLITEWIISNVSLNLKTKQFLLTMTLDLLVYLLKISSIQNYQDLAKSDKFLTQLSLTIFMMNSKTHKKQLAQILELLISNEMKTTEEIIELDKESLPKYKYTMESKLIILESSFKFWQNIVSLLLNNENIIKEGHKKSSWIENLLYSLDFYLNSYKKLNNTIQHIEDNNDHLNIDQEYINISKLKPNFSVVKNLVELLRNIGTTNDKEGYTSVRTYSSSHLTTLWSLVFETVACIDINRIKEEKILEVLISTLLKSSIELQEVTYLVQSSFRISPNSQFICTLLFQALNNSIGTKHEETVYTL